MGSLAAAHKGYFYQDIVTAYFLARSLVEPVRSTTVDAKLHGDDRFDDLLITADDGKAVRRQFKMIIQAVPPYLAAIFEREEIFLRRF